MKIVIYAGSILLWLFFISLKRGEKSLGNELNEKFRFPEGSIGKHLLIKYGYYLKTPMGATTISWVVNLFLLLSIISSVIFLFKKEWYLVGLLILNIIILNSTRLKLDPRFDSAMDDEARELLGELYREINSVKQDNNHDNESATVSMEPSDSNLRNQDKQSISEAETDGTGQYIQLFNDCFSDVTSALGTAPLVSNLDRELIPFLYVVNDIALYAAKKDRASVAEALLENVVGDLDRFDESVAFYGSFISGREARGDWWLGETDSFKDQFLLACMVALGDVLINPKVKDDYDNVPLDIHNANDIVNFSIIMADAVYPRLVDYYQQVSLA